MKKLTEEEVLEKIKNANLDMKLIEKYKGSVRQHHLFKCLVCEKIFNRRLDHIFEKRGCPFCMQSVKYSNSEINEKVKKYKFELVDNYTNNFSNLNWKCLECGDIFESSYTQIRSGNKFCPSCSPKKYKNEILTGQYLHEMFPNIEIFKNHKIDEKIIYDNKIIRSFIRVDYYLILDNEKYIVEYQGHQHYYPTKFWDKNNEEAQQKFKNQIIRDKWLKNYCQENKINLIEIDGRKFRNIKIKTYLEKTFNLICSTTPLLQTDNQIHR